MTVISHEYRWHNESEMIVSYQLHRSRVWERYKKTNSLFCIIVRLMKHHNSSPCAPSRFRGALWQPTGPEGHRTTSWKANLPVIDWVSTRVRAPPRKLYASVIFKPKLLRTYMPLCATLQARVWQNKYVWKDFKITSTVQTHVSSTNGKLSINHAAALLPAKKVTY